MPDKMPKKANAEERAGKVETDSSIGNGKRRRQKNSRPEKWQKETASSSLFRFWHALLASRTGKPGRIALR